MTNNFRLCDPIDGMDSARIASCLGKKKIFLFIVIFGLNCNPKLDFLLDVNEISWVNREKIDGSECHCNFQWLSI